MASELEALAEAIDALTSDPTRFSDPDSILTLHAQLARLDAVTTVATAAFDASGVWGNDGAQTALAWLATRTRVPKGAARLRVRLGRALGHLPTTAKEWLEGQVTGAHVDAIASVRREETKEALERDEEFLVEQAKAMRFADFSRVLAYWAQHADPDGTEDRAEAQRRDRDAYLAPSFSGMWFGKLSFDPISGAIVRGEIDRIAEELFQSDWAQAKSRLGRDPLQGDLLRTAGQRRADAFVLMARRSASADPDARPARPLFTVLVDHSTLAGRVCELSQGIVVSPGSLVQWITEADIERAVFKSPTRVEISEKSRLFTGGTRRGIAVRDKRCSHPYCDRPAEICQVDHIVPFSIGGPTTQENGRLLCEFHNRLRNQRPPPSAA